MIFFRSQHITNTWMCRWSRAYLSITQQERRVNTNSLATSIWKTRGFSYGCNPHACSSPDISREAAAALRRLCCCERLEWTRTLLKGRKQDFQHSTGQTRLTASSYLIPNRREAVGQTRQAQFEPQIRGCSREVGRRTTEVPKWTFSLLTLFDICCLACRLHQVSVLPSLCIFLSLPSMHLCSVIYNSKLQYSQYLHSCIYNSTVFFSTFALCTWH